MSSAYAFWMLVLLLKQVFDHPVALAAVVCPETVPPPGSIEQSVVVCTLPKIWIPIPNMIATAINAATNPMMVLDSAIVSKIKIKYLSGCLTRN